MNFRRLDKKVSNLSTWFYSEKSTRVNSLENLDSDSSEDDISPPSSLNKESRWSFAVGKSESNLLNRRNYESPKKGSSVFLSKLIEDVPFLSGCVKFVDADEELTESHQYALVDKHTDFNELIQYMIDKWELSKPRVVLDVISSKDYSFGTFDTESHLVDFQIGLVHAACRSRMWIITEAVKSSLIDTIGETVADYNDAFENEYEDDKIFSEHKYVITLLGMTPVGSIDYGDLLQTSATFKRLKAPIEIDNYNFENTLEPNHSHYLLMRKEPHLFGSEENRKSFHFSLKSKLISSLCEGLFFHTSVKDAKDPSVPYVGLLIDGGPSEIDRVFWMLRHQIPVIVIKGKGPFASQLIADAFTERSRLSDKLYVEKILKPKMLAKVKQAFPDEFKMDDLAHLKYRDLILNCVKYAVQGHSQFLTVVDPISKNHDLKDLSHYILSAIVLAQSSVKRVTSVNQNLLLALIWNCADVASKVILKKVRKFNIESDLFFRALVTPNREAFVELFLNLGFSLSTFMRETRENEMLDALLSCGFFVENCLKPVIGHMHRLTPREFLYGKKSPYSKILLHVSGLRELVNFSRESSPSIGSGHGSVSAAYIFSSLVERNAQIELIVWSVFTNKPALTRKLWQQTYEPIKIGLIISNMYYRLAHLNITDIDLKKQVYDTSVRFSRLAIDVLDSIDRESSVFAIKSLSTPVKHFDNHTTMELAFIGNNKFFIAHPCCQTALMQSWEGSIKILNIQSDKGIKLPTSIKILCCMFFVFPVFYWIDINKSIFKNNDKENPKDEDLTTGYESSDTKLEDEEEGCIESCMMVKTQICTNIREHLTLLNKIYCLWTAPIAKFWFYLFLYFVHMSIFTYWILLPFCGNVYVTLILLSWNILTILEKLRGIQIWRQKFPCRSLVWQYWDVSVNAYVIAVFALSAYKYFFGFQMITYMDIKTMQSYGMLWYFYRALYFVLPVSPHLGPMLVNITLMIRRDIINWLLLWSMCFISGGIAIYATLMPLHKFNIDFLSSSILTGLYSLYLNPPSTSNREVQRCERKYEDFPKHCNFEESNYTVPPELEKCALKTKASDLLVLQLLAMTRLVFYTVMFAMLSVTINKTKNRALEIWKFQFYQHVTDFESRPVIPAPLSVLLYPWYCLVYLVQLTKLGAFYCHKLCKNIKDIRDDIEASKEEIKVPFNQMKSFVKAVEKKEEGSKLAFANTLTIFERRVQEQQQVINRLHVRIIDAERNTTQANLILESIVQKLEAMGHTTDTKKPQTLKLTHKESRQSPYPGTDIERFPVFEKDIPWAIKFEAYDPSFYSKSVNKYPLDLQPWIDRDKHETKVKRMSQVFRSSKSSVVETLLAPEEHIECLLPKPIHNTFQTFSLANGETVIINRVTFTKSDQELEGYLLDFIGLPINPMGRTGLRGRGSLCRYGPNHSIQAVISRWKAATDTTPSTSKRSGRASITNILEILVVQDHSCPNGVNLPGVELNKVSDPYGLMCKYFDNEIVLDDTGNEYSYYDTEDMMQYFSQFSSFDGKRKKKSHYVSHGFSSTPIFRGYVDSALNTDNAWQETEIWNFHYKYKESFDQKLARNNQVTWIEASATSQLSVVQSAAVVEVCKLHKVKYA